MPRRGSHALSTLTGVLAVAEWVAMFLPLPGTGCAGNPPGQQLSVKTMEKI